MTNDRAVVMLKRAVDPVTIGASGLIGGLSGWLTWKQIAGQKALEKAVQKAQLTRRLLLGALATSTAGGVAAGYSLGKKQPKRTEKTTVMQPIVISPEQAAKISHDKQAIGIFDWLQRLRHQPKPNPANWQEKAEEILKGFVTWDARIPEGGEKDGAADVASHRRALRALVSPITKRLPGLKAVEKRQGSDIVTSSLISDDASTAGK